MRFLLRRWQHQLAHHFYWNGGRPETFWREGKLWVGFHCFGCGGRFDEHRVPDSILKDLR